MQKTYIVMATPHHCGGVVSGGVASLAGSPGPCGMTGHPRLAARYDDPYGAVVDYSPEVEGRVLKATGKRAPLFLTPRIV